MISEGVQEFIVVDNRVFQLANLIYRDPVLLKFTVPNVKTFTTRDLNTKAVSL